MTREQLLDKAVRRKTNAFTRVWIDSLPLHTWTTLAPKFIADILMEFHKLSKANDIQ